MSVEHRAKASQDFSARKIKRMDDTEMIDMQTTNKKLVGMEMQYDPTVDFSIFGLNKVGPLQDKINNADPKFSSTFNDQDSGSTAEKKETSKSGADISNNLPED